MASTAYACFAKGYSYSPDGVGSAKWQEMALIDGWTDSYTYRLNVANYIVMSMESDPFYNSTIYWTMKLQKSSVSGGETTWNTVSTATGYTSASSPSTRSFSRSSYAVGQYRFMVDFYGNSSKTEYLGYQTTDSFSLTV